MNPIFRRVLAIIGLVLMAPFLVFLIMALGFSKVLEGYTVPLASVFGCLVLIIFLLLKMDEVRKKKMEARTQAAKEALEAGAEKDDDVSDATDHTAEESDTAQEAHDGSGFGNASVPDETHAEQSEEKRKGDAKE